jgi:hypothetical protein
MVRGSVVHWEVIVTTMKTARNRREYSILEKTDFPHSRSGMVLQCREKTVDAGFNCRRTDLVKYSDV